MLIGKSGNASSRNVLSRLSNRVVLRARMRGVGLRQGIGIVLLLGVVLSFAQLALNLASFRETAFLLSRAEISYKQLAAYQNLSVATLEYILRPDRSTRERIETGLDAIDTLTAVEVELIAENGGVDPNTWERARLERMGTAIRGFFVQENAGASRASEMSSVYVETVKPLMFEAIGDEEKEVHAVEQSMRALQRTIDWTSPLAAVLQSAALGLILYLVANFVLRPLSRLVADIREFGRGRLAHRVSVKRHDEFGLLGQHINRMARHLERGRQALEASNEGLEATVGERTQELSARNADLREIDESRRRFFADVSHELRTPLTAIVGEADVTLRMKRTDTETFREALSSIRANANFLNRRIDDLMALARSPDGRLEIEHESVDLNRVADEASGEAQSLGRIHDVTIALSAGQGSVWIRGDRRRLRQCLMILLDNAVKFSRRHQTVDVRLLLGADYAEIAVIDHGRGIAVTELPRVFERFYQTEVGRSMGGTGLGLAIARRIVEAHAGRIALDRNETGGTTATITLPFAKGAQP